MTSQRRRHGSHEDGFFLNSPLAAFVFDPHGCVLSWNPAAAATFGWDEAEVLGRRLPIVPPQSQEEFSRLLQHVLAGNRISGFEAVRQRKDGTPIAVRISAAPFHDARGSVIGVLAMVEDLSVTRSLERSIAETNRLLFALVEASPVAVVVADAESRIRIWNAAAAELYGWTAAELVGQPVDVIASTSAGSLLARLAAKTRSTRIPASIVSDVRRDGTNFVASPVAVAVAERECSVATMALVRDVSAQVQAERAAIEASEELRALTLRTMNVLEEERVRISREIHDDLGQLLTAVTFELAAVRRSLREDAEVTARLDSMATTLNRGMVSVRRITADLRPPLLDAIGLNAALHEEVTAFQERTGIECNLSLPDRDLGVHGELATAVYRVAQEALTNVARHAEAHSVDMRLRLRDRVLYLELRDDGRGIDASPRRAGALGLVGMRERATSVGGELRIGPGRPRGTVVTLIVPIGEER